MPFKTVIFIDAFNNGSLYKGWGEQNIVNAFAAV